MRMHLYWLRSGTPWSTLWIKYSAKINLSVPGSHTSVRALENAMLDYIDQRNLHPKPFVWTRPPI